MEAQLNVFSCLKGLEAASAQMWNYQRWQMFCQSCQWHLEWLLMYCARAQVMVKTHQVTCSTGTAHVDWIMDMLSLTWSFAPVGHAWPQSLLNPLWKGCYISLFLLWVATHQVQEDWYMEKYLRVVLASFICKVSGGSFSVIFLSCILMLKSHHKSK